MEQESTTAVEVDAQPTKTPTTESPANAEPKKSFFGSVWAFMKKNAMMLIAMLAAVITMFFVPPDAEYAQYFDVSQLRTLTCLFCTLAVICALKNVRFFYILARKVVQVFKTARISVLAIVYITFIGSMLLANDMALLTFLPLGFLVLTTTKKQKYMAFTFIMQNIAANLGGMLTPFGNPQNLFLYNHFEIPTGEFVGIMLPPFILAVTLITLCCLIFVKPEPLELPDEQVKLPIKRTVIYLVLFAFAIALILIRDIPFPVWIALAAIVPIVLLFMDGKSLLDVDYPLLLTFVSFFVFAGNMGRIEAVGELLRPLMETNTLLFSTLSCQFISNVPSATLLAQFTSNYQDLLVGVNIGGVGTLIASLASLITFREYTKNNPGKTKYYVGLFSAFNFAFLFILTGFMLLLGIWI